MPMALSDEFIEYVLDQFSRWGGVSVRKMFGGAGLYRDQKMFGLIANDAAYLKVDDSNREVFEKAGSSAFYPYPEKGKSAAMPYYEIPVDVLENPDELVEWSKKSLAITNKIMRKKKK